jgi:hypothetical protein
MLNEQEIERLSKQYNLSCKVFYNSIYINSIYRNWICEQRGQFYRIKHINGEQYKHKNHMHKKPYKTLQDVFEYINKHDTQTILDRHKNTRLKYEKLYNQIHTY